MQWQQEAIVHLLASVFVHMSEDIVKLFVLHTYK